MIGSSCARPLRVPGTTASSAPSFESRIRTAASTGLSRRGRPLGTVTAPFAGCGDLFRHHRSEGARGPAVGTQRGAGSSRRERTQELEASNARLRESERRFPPARRRRDRLRDLHARSRGQRRQLEPGRRAHQGLQPRRKSSASISRASTPRRIGGTGFRAQLSTTPIATGKYEAEGWRVRKDGSRFWASVVINAIRDADGKLLGFAKVTRDLTGDAARQPRSSSARSQKMEAIGQLTGGIAHDFNNLLTVIIRQSRDAAASSGAHLPERAPAAIHRRLRLRGASRAALLTQRLLAFLAPPAARAEARRRQHASSPACPSCCAARCGEAIAIETVLAGGLWHTLVDPNQLENRPAEPRGQCARRHARRRQADDRDRQRATSTRPMPRRTRRCRRASMS